MVCALALCGNLAAQQGPSDSSSTAPEAAEQTPDAPTPQVAPADQPAQQTKRILGIIPNFRAVSTDVKLPPMTVKEKFISATEDSFDYSAIFIPAILALYSEETNATPEFGQGAVGYGRYLWHTAVDQTSENYMVEFVGPVLTHEDPRYYTLGRGGFIKRTGYALSRAVVTRSDSGKEAFNISEVVGSGACQGVLAGHQSLAVSRGKADGWGAAVGTCAEPLKIAGWEVEARWPIVWLCGRLPPIEQKDARWMGHTPMAGAQQ